jgi:hypothetical protein
MWRPCLSVRIMNTDSAQFSYWRSALKLFDRYNSPPFHHWHPCSLSFLTWSSPLSPLVRPRFCFVRPSVVSPPNFFKHLIHTLRMETVCTSEMSVYFNETTRRYIPEGCLHTCRVRACYLVNITSTLHKVQVQICHYFLGLEISPSSVY